MASLWDDLESLVESPSSFSAPSGVRGTIKPKGNFDPNEDAAALRKAMKGLGTNEKVLIDILTHRSNAQRQLICKAYQDATGNALQDDLKGDTHGDFEDLLVALITPPDGFDSHEVMRAMKGVGSKDSILIEIFASRSNQQIKALQEAFLKETGNRLTDELKGEVSGDFSKALLLLAEGNRNESTTVDVKKAKEDAETLYSAGEKKWGTDESKFIDILCQRSVPQLRQTLVEYKNISGKTLQQSIEGEMSGELEELLVAVVKCVKSVPVYFAERLHKSMKGGGTDESTLTRIMVSRSEIDLLDIRAEFKKLYQGSLLSALQVVVLNAGSVPWSNCSVLARLPVPVVEESWCIRSDLSGDYGECMKAICGGDD